MVCQDPTSVRIIKILSFYRIAEAQVIGPQELVRILPSFGSDMLDPWSFKNEIKN